MSSLYRIDYTADGSGSYVQDVAGEALGKHKLVYLAADSKWYLSDANDPGASNLDFSWAAHKTP